MISGFGFFRHFGLAQVGRLPYRRGMKAALETTPEPNAVCDELRKKKSAEQRLSRLRDAALAGVGCDAEDALWLAEEAGEKELIEAACAVREAFFGNKVELCSIINAKSGKCDMNCTFCSQSRYNCTEIEEYPMMPVEELEERIHNIIDGEQRLCGVVTSGGRLSPKEVKELAKVVKKIGGGKPAPVCGSLGRLAAADLRELKEAGITRLHHNLEASENYYPNICTTQTWQQRLATVRAALESGLELCCGGLFGLGESWQDRVDLASELRSIGITSVPINFLYSHEGTPLAGRSPLSPSEALRVIAVYRFMLPKATLRICGGRTHVLKDRQAELFAAGANGLMTGNYLTVSGKVPDEDLAMLNELGLEIEKTCFA